MYSLWSWALYVLWLCLTAVLLEKQAKAACKLTCERFPAQLTWGLGLFVLPVAVLAAVNIGAYGRFSLFRFLALPVGKATAFFLFQLLVAVTEECFFRGWMQHRLQKRLPRWAAVCVTAVLFALLHLSNGLQVMNMVVPLALGLLFGFAKERVRDCTVPSLVLAHLLYDLAIVNVTI